MDFTAKRLRANTNYPWWACIEAARRNPNYDIAIELLPVILREADHRCERCRKFKPHTEFQDNRAYCKPCSGYIEWATS